MNVDWWRCVEARLNSSWVATLDDGQEEHIGHNNLDVQVVLGIPLEYPGLPIEYPPVPVHVSGTLCVYLDAIATFMLRLSPFGVQRQQKTVSYFGP